MSDILENVEGNCHTEKMENFSKLFTEKHSTDEKVYVDAESASILAISGYLDTTEMENEPPESLLCGTTSYGTKVYIDLGETK